MWRGLRATDVVLQLGALDTEDLAVISAHMQDAVLLVGDMTYHPKRKQFALVANRFAWDETSVRQRRRSGLHFDRVLAVKTLNVSGADKNAVLSLLAITFSESDAPSGEVLLSFSGGATVRLDVECLECQLKDLGPAWETEHLPQHPLDDDLPEQGGA
jgi:hypothetical protein